MESPLAAVSFAAVRSRSQGCNRRDSPPARAQRGAPLVENRFDKTLNVPDGVLNDRARDFIVLFRIVHDHGREFRVIPRCCGIHPLDGKPGIVIEFRRYRGAQGRRPRSAVERPQGVSHRAQPERRTAAFVGNRKAITPDRGVDIADLDVGDAAGAKHEGSAVLAEVGAEIGNCGIRFETHGAEGEFQPGNRPQHSRPGHAGDAHARLDQGHVALVEPGVGDRFPGHVHQHGMQAVKADAGIRRPRPRLAENGAIEIGQPRPRMAAAGVNPQKIAHVVPPHSVRAGRLEAAVQTIMEMPAPISNCQGKARAFSCAGRPSESTM